MELGDGDKTNQNTEPNEESGRIVVVTDPALVASIDKMLQKASSFSSERCIYRVPEPLRSVNSKAYTPKVISIGPLHYGKRDLMAQEHKRRYLQNFLHLTKLTTQAVIEQVKTWEKRARNCYAEIIKMTTAEFVQLLLLDGCFVIMFIIGSQSPELRDMDTSFLWRFGNGIFCDLLLLENQLPFFVLQGLYDSCASQNPSLRSVSLIELTRQYFIHAHEKGMNFLKRDISVDESKVNHFVDFIRMNLIHSCSLKCQDVDTSFRRSVRPPTATELNNCGVSFKPKKKKKKQCAMDIAFIERGGVLELPQILIYDTFEIRVRNLIAYEQCHGSRLSGDDSSSFVIFMHCLVNTNKDVRLLIDSGIIQNNLGSVKEVTQLFNNLCKHVPLGRNFYNCECVAMKNYCKRRRHRWMTSLRRDYFNTPWAFVSFIAAVFLLALTLVQAATAVVSLYR